MSCCSCVAFSCLVGFYPVMYSYLQVCKYAVAFFSRGIQTFTCDVLNSFVLGRWEEGSGATEAMILSAGSNADLRCRTSDGVLLKSESWLCRGIVLRPQERQVHFLSDFLHVRKGGQDIFRAVLDKCCEDWLVNAGMVFWKYRRSFLKVFCRHRLSNPCPWGQSGMLMSAF